MHSFAQVSFESEIATESKYTKIPARGFFREPLFGLEFKGIFHFQVFLLIGTLTRRINTDSLLK